MAVMEGETTPQDVEPRNSEAHNVESNASEPGSAATPNPGSMAAIFRALEKLIRGILDLLLDVATVSILPLVLGYFAVSGLYISARANDQSQVANQIALLALCLEHQNVSEACDQLLTNREYFWNITSALFSIQDRHRPRWDDQPDAVRTLPSQSGADSLEDLRTVAIVFASVYGYFLFELTRMKAQNMMRRTVGETIAQYVSTRGWAKGLLVLTESRRAMDGMEMRQLLRGVKGMGQRLEGLFR